MESNKLEYKLYNKSVVVCTNEWKQPKCHCDMLLLFSLGPISGMAKCSPFWAGTWLEWIRLSRIFRAPFANLSLEMVNKMSRYYLLSGLSRIFCKPFANVYISRKVPFAQTFQIYACGPRLYKTFLGFLHDSHIYIYILSVNISMQKRIYIYIHIYIHICAPIRSKIYFEIYMHAFIGRRSTNHPLTPCFCLH